MHGAQTIALAPLSDSETAALVSELLGSDPSVSAVITMITEKAAGNPFFAEEMVRDLPSAASYAATAAPTIDRRCRRGQCARHLAGDNRRPHRPTNPAAKRTWGRRCHRFEFQPGPTGNAGDYPVLEDLLGGEFIDQIRFVRQPEYVFHHPLVRTVAYESQLKSDPPSCTGASRRRSNPVTRQRLMKMPP